MSKPHSVLQTCCSSRLLQGNFVLNIGKGSLRMLVAYVYDIPASRTVVIVPGTSGQLCLTDKPLCILYCV